MYNINYEHLLQSVDSSYRLAQYSIIHYARRPIFVEKRPAKVETSTVETLHKPIARSALSDVVAGLQSRWSRRQQHEDDRVDYAGTLTDQNRVALSSIEDEQSHT